MKETYKRIILKKRYKKRGGKIVEPTGVGTIRTTVLQNFFRPLHMLLTEVGPSSQSGVDAN